MTQALALFVDGVWGWLMLRAAVMTLLVAGCAYLAGLVIGLALAAAKLSGIRPLAWIAEAYTTILRGVPELLIIYLIFFGGSSSLMAFAQWFGLSGRIEVSPFAAGVASVGAICGAYATEVIRGAILAVDRGQLEAARAFGLTSNQRMRRIILPQAARHALPGLGNIWLSILKLTSLISVVGLVEIMRQAGIGHSATRQPFTFYLVAAMLYILLTGTSALLLKQMERRAAKGVRHA